MTAERVSVSSREDRKMRKPLIERRRRERINQSLEQLRETVITVFRLDQSKLEKADILEMTVKHLQNIQNSKVHELVPDPEAQQKFSTGYIQCMHEVHNLLLSCEWMDKTLGSRLLNHLLKSLPRSGAPHPDPTRYHGNEEERPRSCPASPCTGTNTSISSDAPSPSRPTESPQITTLEMWRPW